MKKFKKFTDLIKDNKFLFVFIVIFIILFYWYGIRPSIIKSNCADDGSYYGGSYYGYDECLHRAGL